MTVTKPSCANFGVPLSLLAAVFLASGAAAQSTDKTPTLKDTFKKHFYVGVAISRNIVTGQRPLGGVFVRSQDQFDKDIALVKEQFDQISPENDLNWESTQPWEGANYNFGPADAYVDFGLKNHMLIVGHALVWHGRTPTWVFSGTSPTPGGGPAPAPIPRRAPFGGGFGGGFGGRMGDDRSGNSDPLGRFGGFGGTPFFFTGPYATRDQLLQRMHDHIATVVGRYKGKIQVWDVVNECVSDGGPDILRNSLWRQIIGPDFVAKAFQYTHEADPKAILRLNDYGLENSAKRRKFITLVKQLQAEKVPIGAIGTETHVGLSSPSFAEEDQTLTDLETLGLPIHVTELDVNGTWAGVNGAWAGGAWLGQRSTGANIANNAATTRGGLVIYADQRFADEYADLFKAFLKHKRVKVITFWGVNDALSLWANNHGPLLFDGNDQPKPAFDAVIQAARGK